MQSVQNLVNSTPSILGALSLDVSQKVRAVGVNHTLISTRAEMRIGTVAGAPWELSGGRCFVGCEGEKEEEE